MRSLDLALFWQRRNNLEFNKKTKLSSKLQNNEKIIKSSQISMLLRINFIFLINVNFLA